MAALVPEKVYVCDAASSVPNSSAVPARSYSPCHADQYIDKKIKKKNNVIKKKIEYVLGLGGGVRTFTRTVVPNATSKRHSDPLPRLTCVGGAGANSLSTEACERSKPGRAMLFLENRQRGELTRW